MEKKIVLWVSRHPPLQSQVDSLKLLLGEPDIKQVTETFTSAEEVMRIAEKIGASVIVPVLPLSMTARLVELAGKRGIDVWYAEMEVLHTREEGEPCEEFREETDVIMTGKDSATNKQVMRHFRFKKFKRIKKIEMILEEI